MIVFAVHGIPRARPRARNRAMRTKVGRILTKTYHPSIRTPPVGREMKPHEKAWMLANLWYDAVKEAVTPHLPPEPWRGPVHVEIEAYFPRPESFKGPRFPTGKILHTGKPDRDNLDKSVLDALKEAGLFEDDGQVCMGAVKKWYAAAGASPGVKVTAKRVDALLVVPAVHFRKKKPKGK